MNPLKLILGWSDILILQTLAESKISMTAIQIHQKLEDDLNDNISISALYVTLGRLKKKKFISCSEKKIPPGIKGGKPKRAYRIQQAGIKELTLTKESILKVFNINHQLPAC